MWPLKLAHVLLALTYFSTGMSKLIVGGPAWMNGYTLQQYTFADAVHREIPLGLWLAQQHTLAIAMSIFTILLETFFFVSLFVSVDSAVHLSLRSRFSLCDAGHKFFQHIALLIVLLLFINPGWWRTWLTRSRPRSSRAVAAEAH